MSLVGISVKVKALTESSKLAQAKSRYYIVFYVSSNRSKRYITNITQPTYVPEWDQVFEILDEIKVKDQIFISVLVKSAMGRDSIVAQLKLSYDEMISILDEGISRDLPLKPEGLLSIEVYQDNAANENVISPIISNESTIQTTRTFKKKNVEPVKVETPNIENELSYISSTEINDKLVEDKVPPQQSKRDSTDELDILLGQINITPDNSTSQIFHSIDKDGDGKLDITELTEIMETLGFDLSPGLFHSIIDNFSKDKTLELTMEEFTHMMDTIKILKNNFGVIDADNSGRIDFQELDTLLKALKFDFSSHLLGRILDLKSASSKREGLLFEELVEFYFELKSIKNHFEIEDADHSGILDSAELQSLLRSLGLRFFFTYIFGVPASVQEIKLCIEELIAENVLKELDLEGFIELLYLIQLRMDKIRLQAKRIRRDNRKKPPKKETRSYRNLSVEKLLKAEEEAEDIISQCKQTKQKYKDPNFPRDTSSLFPNDYARGGLVQWKRASDIPGSDLFVDGIDEGDVMQGRLGDCWFLSALSTVAYYGVEPIKDLFIGQFPQYGFYQCCFYKNGEWQLVTIDDYLPFSSSNIAFGRCKDPKEIWVPLIEKAYAKLHGSYGAIETGSIGEGLSDLTGCPSEILEHFEPDGSLWNMLIYNVEESFLMGCTQTNHSVGETEVPTDTGILINHAYSILDCNFLEDLQIRLLKIRNPWGKKEWNGKWSDGSKEWTPELIERLNVTFDDDGTFFIEFEDFCRQFNTLFVVRCMEDDVGAKWENFSFRGEWKGRGSAGCRDNARWFMNPQYKVQNFGELCRVFISLQLDDLRLKNKQLTEYHPTGLIVIEKLYNDDCREIDGDDVIETTFYESRSNSCEFLAKPGKTYVVLPATLHRGIESRYFISIFTEHASCFASELTQERHMTVLKGSWTETTCGGCANFPSFPTNPKFKLVIEEETFVSLVLIQPGEIDDFALVGIHVLIADNTGRPVKKFKTSDFGDTLTISLNIVFQPGTYAIVPCTYEPNERYTAYGLMVNSTLPLNITQT